MESASDGDIAGPSSAARGASRAQAAEEAGAPRYTVAPRTLSAVEVPAVVENVDRAVKAFGRFPTLDHALDPARSSIPLYLNPESPFCKPLMSHNAPSHNVVLKIIVPKRTGRRRKRGSTGPWLGDLNVSDASDEAAKAGNVQSVARLDEPKILRRKLADNVSTYHVEAVGIIKQTHRFRALADFYWDMTRSDFAQKFVDQVLPGHVENLKQFSFEEGIDRPPNVDIIPPPIFTHMSLPFNYYYSQNPYVRTTEDGNTFNMTAVKQVGHFIRAEDPTPEGPQLPPDMTDLRAPQVLAELDEAFKFRPLWTRRSLMNHLQGRLTNENELKKYLNYAAYQFKGGPWRDSVVPYGLDPRTDPKYRIYQTLMFKLNKHERTAKDQSWQSVRRFQAGASYSAPGSAPNSHVFDGETYSLDGKVWQVCDISDPLLKGLLDSAAVRPRCDFHNSGWYHGGLWAKVKAIMKTKLVSIQFGKQLTETDFAATLEYGDLTPVRSASNTMHLPLPDLDLTNEELTQLRGTEPTKKKSRGYNVRFRDSGNSPSLAAEQLSTPFGGDSVIGEGKIGSDTGESASDEFDLEEYANTDHGQRPDRLHSRDYGERDDEEGGMGIGQNPYPELD